MELKREDHQLREDFVDFFGFDFIFFWRHPLLLLNSNAGSSGIVGLDSQSCYCEPELLKFNLSGTLSSLSWVLQA